MNSGNRSDKPWRACVAAVIGVLALTLSPLVLTAAVTGPWLFGLPRTLWAGFAAALVLLLLTCIGAVVHPEREDPPS